MELKWFPKLLLWVMLIVSSLGAIASLFRAEVDPTPAVLKRTLEQQMAIHAALGFAREWMHWDGEELPEARLQRLKPYIHSDASSRIAALQVEHKTNRQEVIATEFISISSKSGSWHTVRVRVSALNPGRVIWEIDVPVWVNIDKGAAISDPPLIRNPHEPPTVPKGESGESTTSSETTQRMRPVIESFLRAMCEGQDTDRLSNYVTSDATVTPLESGIQFLSLERLESTGSGPYSVTATFTIQDDVTGFGWTQVWQLTVIEQNQKFFIATIHSPVS